MIMLVYLPNIFGKTCRNLDGQIAALKAGRAMCRAGEQAGNCRLHSVLSDLSA
jgi:hypothetical protein